MPFDSSYLLASDGTGDASLMHITANRSVASTVIAVDTVVGVPAKFIGTAGTVLPSGLLNPTTVTNFYGQVSGANLQIDGFLPGNTDVGNTIGQIVVIKPSTDWANMVANHILTPTGCLAYAEITSNFVPGTISTTDVTGLSVTVNIPTGGKRIKITCKAEVYSPGGAQGVILIIREGTTTLQTNDTQVAAVNKATTTQFSAIITPTAGSHTYKIATSVDTVSSNTPAIQASAGATAFILVETL